jgi:hypothetical protein
VPPATILKTPVESLGSKFPFPDTTKACPDSCAYKPSPLKDCKLHAFLHWLLLQSPESVVTMATLSPQNWHEIFLIWLALQCKPFSKMLTVKIMCFDAPQI